MTIYAISFVYRLTFSFSWHTMKNMSRDMIFVADKEVYIKYIYIKKYIYAIYI